MLGPYSSGLTQAMPLSSSRSTRCRWWRGTAQRASSSQKPTATTLDQYLVDTIELAAANAGKLGQGGRRGHSGVAFISLTAVIAPLSCPETMSCLLRCAMAQVPRL
jgi:hypothetical protein